MLALTIDHQRNHQISRALKPATGPECLRYAESVIGIIQPLLMTRRKQSLSAEVFDTEGRLRVVKFQFEQGKEAKPEPRLMPRQGLSAVLDRIAASLDSEMSTQLYTRRHLRLYAGDTFYVIKPAARRHWSRAAGMADADSVLRDLMGTDRV